MAVLEIERTDMERIEIRRLREFEIRNLTFELIRIKIRESRTKKHKIRPYVVKTAPIRDLGNLRDLCHLW